MAITSEIRTKWPGLLGLLVFAVALWAQTSAMVGVFFDDGIYIQLAKSLAEGTGYHSIHLPGAPPAVHYPPVYPFLLSLLWRIWPIFPANVALFQLLDAAALGAAAMLIAAHSRRVPVPAWASAVVLLLAFTAFPLLTLVGVRFSEPVFIALVAGALLVADSPGGSRSRTAVAAGALAGFATLTRSIGIAAIGGVTIALWRRGHRRSAMLAGITAGVMIVPWAVWLALNQSAIDPLLVSNYGTYGQFAGQGGLLGALGGLDFRAFDPLRRLLLPTVPFGLTILLAGLLVVGVAIGTWKTWSRCPALVGFITLYMIVVTLWPYAPDRFVWIVLPYLGLVGAAGVAVAWNRGTVTRWITVGMLGVLAVGYVPRELGSVRNRSFAQTANVPSDRFGLLTASIVQALPEEAVVATDGEALVHLYTGRTTLPVFLFRLDGRETVRFSTDSTVAYWCRQGVTHVAASAPGQDVVPLFLDLESNPDISVRTLMAVSEGPRLMELTCER